MNIPLVLRSGGRSGAVATTEDKKWARSTTGDGLGFTGELKTKEVVEEAEEDDEEEKVGSKCLLKKAALVDASLLSQAEVESNRHQQEDEVLALQSIYGPDYVSIDHSERGGSTGLCPAAFMIRVHLKIPDEGIKIEADESARPLLGLEANECAPQSLGGEANEDDDDDDNSFTVQALPPISLLCVLPATYPSHSAPLFELNSLWVSPQKLSSLCASLDAVWEETSPEVVVYTWSEWLRSEALQHVGASEKLRLQLELGEKSAAGGEGELDKRAVSGLSESFDVDIVQLLRYNEEVKNREFLESLHSCSICYAEYAGRSFTRLQSCHHHFCKGCMQQYLEMKLKDGAVMNLTCPAFSCKETVPSSLLRELLDEESFERWEELLAQKTLDLMPDVIYCPRCRTPSMEDSDHLVQCPHCRFTYCSLCMSNWHTGQNCMNPEARLRVLQARRQGRVAGEEALRQERELINEVLDMDYIKKEAKQCPQCRIAVEKSEGCNKMTCGNCGDYFCFQCGRSVTGYDHFRSSSSCVLFDQTEINRWEVQFNLQLQEQQEHVIPRNPRGFMGMAAARPCPNCKQVNYKEGGNNHLFCWACQNHYCGLCQKMVRRGAGHFGSGANKCKQHTPD